MFPSPTVYDRVQRFSNASCVLLVLIAAVFQAVHCPQSRRFNNVIYRFCD
jgi:hypothetical protein